MIEFKQIVGRGTRLFDGKEYFTIYDFVDAYHHFADLEWDGEPVETVEDNPELKNVEDDESGQKHSKIKIKLKDKKQREIQHMITTSFWSPEGKPRSAEEFLHNLFGALPEFFKSEEELRTPWSDPITRKALLEKLSEAGYGKDELETLQKLINSVSVQKKAISLMFWNMFLLPFVPSQENYG